MSDTTSMLTDKLNEKIMTNNNKNIVIYKYVNIINGKIYVGQSNDFERRKSQHLRKSKNNPIMVIDKAIAKYGIENFDIILIENIYQVEDAIADKIEENWIVKLNSLVPNGYNIKKGGKTTRGWHHSEESKNKMSQSKMGISIGIGHYVSEETKQKISLAQIGKSRQPHSEITKQKISASNTGKRLSEETKQKLSQSHIGKIPSPETRKKMSDMRKGENNPNAKLTFKDIINIQNDDRQYKYIAKDYNVSTSTICRVKLSKE